LVIGKLPISVSADRTNGRAYATVLRPSVVVCLSVTLCIVAKRCILAKVTIVNLYEVVYEKSLGTKMNDIDLCLEVVWRSCQPLRYIRHWMHAETVRDRGLVKRTTNRKWLDPKPNFSKITDGWKKFRLIFGLAELSR